MLLSVVVVAALVWYIMTPAERERAVRGSIRSVGRVMPCVRTVARLFRRDRDELLEQMLRERTPWPAFTMLIAALNLGLFVWMHAAPSTPVFDALANHGPRTANGEWSRLITATFIHTNVFILLLNTTAVVQVGILLERLVGSLTFAAVYLVAAVFASLASLSTSQVDTSIGASGAVFGVYGLLIAAWMWGTLQHADTTLRLRTIKAFAPVAGVFAVVSLLTRAVPAGAECLGLVTGFTCGLLTGRAYRASKPPVRRVATIAAAGAYLAIVAAVPLRGVTDARPVLQAVVEAEERTTAVYDKALDDFRNGRTDQKGLAQVIDKHVLPQLQFVRFELQRLGRAPREHLPLIQAAEIYSLRRIESWKIRSSALRDGNSRLLRDAESVERTALERLQRIKATG